MVKFVIVGHKAVTTPDFSLEDLPGTSGRMDILCRCINSAFVLSHGIRQNAQVYLVLLGGNPKTVCLKGDRLRHLNPDERTTAALLKKALALVSTSHWTRSTPGIYVRSGGLADLLKDLLALPEGEALPERIFYLREDGADVRGRELEEEAIYILGDHMGMEEEEEDLILGAGAELISVGPKSLHSDHCIVLINNELDRR